MDFSVTVARREFADALLSLKKVTKTKKPFEMILSYNGGFLLIQSVGGSHQIPAEGKANLDVHLPGEPMFKLAEVLPEISPFTLELAGGKLRLGPLLLPCTTAQRKPFIIQMPVNPREMDFLSLRYRHSINEITRSGYMKQYLEAEKCRESSIKKAARLLEPLGVKASDITSLVENCLKKNADM